MGAAGAAGAGAALVRLPLNGGIAWMTMLILLPLTVTSLLCGLADEEVLTRADALDEAAAG